MQVQALASTIVQSQNKNAGLIQETNRLLAEQSKTLARDLVAAMIQANP